MAFTWTGGAADSRKASVFSELKTNYTTAQNSVAFSPAYAYGFTAGNPTGGTTPVRALHFSELQAAINTLESKMSGNCNCANCCQTCQTTYCQSYSCQYQSCQSQCNCDCSCGGMTDT